MCKCKPNAAAEPETLELNGMTREGALDLLEQQKTVKTFPHTVRTLAKDTGDAALIILEAVRGISARLSAEDQASVRAQLAVLTMLAESLDETSGLAWSLLDQPEVQK